MIVKQLEKLECAKAVYHWLPLVTFGYLWLPLVTFTYISLPSCTFLYLSLAFLKTRNRSIKMSRDKRLQTKCILIFTSLKILRNVN